MEQWTQTSNKSFPYSSGFSSSRSSSATTRISVINDNVIDLPPSATTKAFKIPHGSEKRRNGKIQDVRGRENKFFNATRHHKNNNKGYEQENNHGNGFQYTLTNKGHNDRGMDASKNNTAKDQLGFQGRPAIRPAASPRGGNPSKNLHDIKQTTTMKKPDVSTLRINPLFKIKPDVRLGLAGDRVSGSVLDQRRGQNGVKPISRSSTKTTFGSAKHGTSPSPSGLSSQGRHCDACAVEYVRHWLKANPSTHNQETQQDPNALKTKASTSHQSGSQEESEAPKEAKSEAKAYHEPLQLLKTGEEESPRILSAPLITGPQNHIFMLMTDAQKVHDYRLNREPANLHTVSIPKRGLIKLTGLAYELDNPKYYDDRRELSNLLDQQKYQEELYGSALPQPSCDAHRGWLIRDKSMIQQVKDGQKRLLAEQEEEKNRQMVTNVTLNTLVDGLLHYEMPQVPTLNLNMQKFIGFDSETEKNHVKRGKSRSASLSTGFSKPADQLPSTPRTTRSVSHNGHQTPANTPRVAFTEGDDRVNVSGQLDTPRLDSGRQNLEYELEPTLHRMISDAQKIHQSRIHDKNKSENFVLPVLSPQ